MTIKQRVQEEMKAAMKSRDRDRLECLRLVKAALTLKEKESGGDLDDAAAVAVLRSEVRKRRDSIDMFLAHDKQDEAAASEDEFSGTTTNSREPHPASEKVASPMVIA